MEDFFLYFNVGLKHITDLKGIDHILFLTALCIRYQFKNWKQVIILITAFTVGHSVTLILSSFNLVKISINIIEFIIPVTIILTAVSNLFIKKVNHNKTTFSIYIFTLFFGLIHGLGFSNYFKSLLGPETSITSILFAFNVGIEIGQILIVFFILFLSFIFINLLKFNQREFLLVTNGIIIGFALQMCIQRNPFKINNDETTHAGMLFNTFSRYNSTVKSLQQS
jgi:hypothetical protein